ncbi:MAG: transporter associated domain-containing protein [Burkholderiaceae bacterium]
MIRGNRVLEPGSTGVPRVNDVVYLLAKPDDLVRLDEAFADNAVQARAAERAYFGDFTVRPDAPIGALAQFYGASVEPDRRTMTVGELLAERFANPVVGDRMQVGELEFTVREIRDGRIHSVGLKLHRSAPG